MWEMVDPLLALRVQILGALEVLEQHRVDFLKQLPYEPRRFPVELLQARRHSQ